MIFQHIIKHSLSHLLRLVDTMISIKAGHRGYGINWLPAPPSLSETIASSVSTPGRRDELPWIQHQFDGPAGIMQIKHAQILSIMTMKAKSDPLARHVHCITGLGRPIRHGRMLPITARLKARIKQLPKGPDSQHETVVLLGSYYTDCNNYYHFWCDAIGDLWFLRQMGVNIEGIDRFVMPFGPYPWQKQVLEICGIEEHKVLPLSDFSRLRTRQLLLPMRPKGGCISPIWLLRAMREMAHWHPPTKGDRRIYISRRDARRRALLNEQQVIDFLHSRGFEIYQCSALTVREQQQLFASASLIIAPHGAALTNIAWCNPGTRILELTPRHHLNPCFRDMCEMGGFEHSVIVTMPADKDKPGLTGSAVVDMDELKHHVDRMEQLQSA